MSIRAKRLLEFLLAAGPFVCFGLIVGGLVVWSYFAFSNDFVARPFESAIWRNCPSEMSHRTVRLSMVDDLLAKHRFVGMLRKDVVALLGEPDDTDYFREYDLVYHLGQERGFMPIDSEWLVFRVDDKVTVLEVHIAHD